MISCKNCGGYFTAEEMARRKPPVHAWQLTPVGEKVFIENQANGGDPRPCPTCGCRTMRE
jgi:hypothetical protein